MHTRLDKRISVAYIIDSLTSRDGVVGGTERQLIDVIRRIDRSRFRPILFCLRDYGLVPVFDGSIPEKHLLNVSSLLSLGSLRSLLYLAGFLRRESVDFVQTFFHDATFFGVMAASIARVPKTISCRRDLGFWYDKKTLSSLRMVNFLSNSFLVNSVSVMECLVSMESVSPDKVHVIYNGIDYDYFSHILPTSLPSEYPNISKSDRVVGIVANYNRMVKRLDLFVRAADRVSKRVGDVKFLIIGGGRLEAEIRELVRDLGIDEVVVFGGKKNQAASYVKAFDLGVLTSDSEGFSNTLLEYMAAGVPAVATDVGGNRELVDHGLTGLLVPPGDDEAIAQGIIELLEDEPWRRRIGEAARQVVRDRYDWSVKIKEIECYYQSLLERDASRTGGRQGVR